MADIVLKKGDKNKANALFFICDTMEEKKDQNKLFKELLPYIVIIIVVLLFKCFIITPIKVNGSSMAPTLQDGDLMILDIISFKLRGAKRFDVLVVDQGQELLIKRVIGLPGEKVEVRSNTLYINGDKVKDPYINEMGKGETIDIQLGKDEYFVMGDNRSNSMDSRVFGPFKKSQIKGKTDLIFYPFYRFQVVDFEKSK